MTVDHSHNMPAPAHHLHRFAKAHGLRHSKKIARSFAWQGRHWQGKSRAPILIDTASDRSLGNGETKAANIYLGDISSQVYEFLSRPRPCMFLNADGVKWQDDINFLFWQLGERSLGDTSFGAAHRAVNKMNQHLRDGKVAL